MLTTSDTLLYNLFRRLEPEFERKKKKRKRRINSTTFSSIIQTVLIANKIFK